MHVVTADEVRHIGVTTGGQVVGNHYPVAISEKSIAQMRPDETRTSSNDDPATSRQRRTRRVHERPTPS